MFGTVEGADEYHAARGRPEWLGDGREEALARAATWLQATYGHRLPTPIPSSQLWRVEWATYEAALHELNQPGTLGAIQDPTQRIIRARVEGAVDVQYANPGQDSIGGLVLPLVEGLLTPLMFTMPTVMVV